MSAGDGGRRPLVVWMLADGKRGHENQSLGLTEALARRVATDVRRIGVPPGSGAWTGWRLPRGGAARSLPDPDLLVGAGHATHVALLSARRARGGRSVVLMRPTLPARLFDLCIVPRHDGVEPGERVVVTQGVLNRLRARPELRTDAGLILVGGPSRHHRWDDAALAAQIRALVEREPDRKWTVALSRRTPGDFARTLAGTLADTLARTSAGALAGTRAGTDRVSVVPSDAVDADWLPDTLVRTGVAWVTEDSVSMVYEALTAGAPTGILAVEGSGTSRVGRGLDALVQAGTVVRLAHWLAGRPLSSAEAPLAEADRCARDILARWPALTR